MRSRGWPITASIGAVVLRKSRVTVEGMVGAADRLMYEVKRSGKNGILLEIPGERRRVRVKGA